VKLFEPGSLWSFKGYRLFWYSTTIFVVGASAFPIALAVTVLDAGGSASTLGLILGARVMAGVVFAPFAGVWADRLPRKNVMMGDVSGSSFKDIAKELGFAAESGAKQAVVKALEKAKFVGTMDPDELEILVLKSMSDYIDMLSNTGELSPADVKLLKDHPDIVRDLEGFREFLDKSIRTTRKVSASTEE
jgi:hypothetical protein